MMQGALSPLLIKGAVCRSLGGRHFRLAAIICSCVLRDAACVLLRARQRAPRAAPQQPRRRLGLPGDLFWLIYFEVF